MIIIAFIVGIIVGSYLHNLFIDHKSVSEQLNYLAYMRGEKTLGSPLYFCNDQQEGYKKND